MNNQQQVGKLRTQLREAYGRVTYSYTTHLKAVDLLNEKNNKMKRYQIYFSAISTGGFLGSFIFDERILTFVAGLVSAFSLGLNLYLKNFELDKLSKEHQITANELWLVREKYVSLLTDLDALSLDQIESIRNELQDISYNIYKTAPKTDSYSYSKAQAALKDEEEQFFSDEELDKMLPKHLRSNQNAL